MYFFPSFVHHINKVKKKPTRGLPWVKISKVMPQPNSSFPPPPQEREGSLTAKSLNLLAKNIVRLNRTHLFLGLTSKIFKFKFYFLAKFPANYTNFVQFTSESHE